MVVACLCAMPCFSSYDADEEVEGEEAKLLSTFWLARCCKVWLHTGSLTMPNGMPPFGTAKMA